MTSETTAETPIVVDGIFFQLNNTGIARLWTEVLSRWQHMDLGRRIVVLDRAGTLPRFEKLRKISCPPLDYARWREDQVLMQKVCDFVGAGLFISTYYTRPERTANLLLLYDMVPERLGYDLNDPMWQQKHDAIRHASAFGAISQNTLSDLWTLFPETRDKSGQVVLLAASSGFFPLAPEERENFHRAFVIPHLGGRPYFLFVSDLWPYKNPDLFLRALKGMPSGFLDTIGLVFTQPDGRIAGFRQLPGVKLYQGRLSEAGLRHAYGSALALIYPSLYEGFGLPVLEAMACGCPVVCTNTSSIPEVAGDAAAITDPHDETTLQRILLDLLKPEFRDALRRKGLERAKLFSWDKAALELAALAETACSAASAGRENRL